MSQTNPTSKNDICAQLREQAPLVDRMYADQLMRDAAKEIARLTRERDQLLSAIGEHVTVRSDQHAEIQRLRHDIERHVAICAEQATEVTRLTRELQDSGDIIRGQSADIIRLARELETRTIQFDSECRHSQLMRDANKRLRALLRDAARQIRSDSGPCPVDMTSRVGLLLTRIDLQLKDSSDETIGSPWQPIETAPKTRRAILVHCPDLENTYEVNWDETPSDMKAGWFHFGTDYRLTEEPSHWMPLPDSSLKAAAEPAQPYQRKCIRCGKMGPSATPEGVGVYYCSIGCAD